MSDPPILGESPFPDAKERVFRARPSNVATVLWLLGGAAAWFFAAIGLVIAILARVDQLTLQLMTTVPVLVGIGAFLAAWSALRSPREVGVGPGGIRMVSRGGTRTYRWDQIGWSTIQVSGYRRHVEILDAGGRTVAKLGQNLGEFDEMAELIAQRIAAKGDATADRIQRRKARRTAVFLAVAGVAFLGLVGAAAWMTHGESRARRLLESDSVEGEATIEERFLAPDGRTPRLVYRVTTPEGRTATRNAEVEREVWDGLEGAETVRVVYVPGEPSVSRLAHGEVEDRALFQSPLFGYGLSAAGGLMALFFLFAAVLNWRGLDIDLDSKTGRISIKRFGSGR